MSARRHFGMGGRPPATQMQPPRPSSAAVLSYLYLLCVAVQLRRKDSRPQGDDGEAVRTRNRLQNHGSR